MSAALFARESNDVTSLMPAAAAPTLSRSRVLMALVLLWLAGNALRLTILAVPPVIPLIHDELMMSATQVGILTGLPSMLLAAAAVPGSLIVAKLGVRWALVVGLLATAIGGALRGAFPSVGWLYAMTIASAAGVAVMQVTMPSAVRAWVPDRIAFATAVYTNGLLIGETLPVALTIPFVLPLIGSWQWGFVFWSAPVLVIALAIAAFAPTPAPIAGAAVRRRWWPDWRNLLIWRLGVMLGTVNAVYFATNAFIPDYLRAHGLGEWISAALTGLNAGQLPASALLLMFARQLQLKAWPIMTVGALCMLATAGIVFGSGPVVVAAASLMGFAAASILILVLALPPLLSPPDDVHRVTAAMFTISYSCAVVIPIISGALWDITGVAALAFAPIGISGLLLILLAPAINHVRPAEG
jgi:CP family cyanate transporter-like MFS transporter